MIYSGCSHTRYYSIVLSLCQCFMELFRYSEHSHLVQLFWYLLVKGIPSDHSHRGPAGEGLKPCDIPLKTMTKKCKNSFCAIFHIKHANSRSIQNIMKIGFPSVCHTLLELHFHSKSNAHPQHCSGGQGYLVGISRRDRENAVHQSQHL